MNEAISSDSASNAAWPMGGHLLRAPDTSMLPAGNEASLDEQSSVVNRALPPAAGMLDSAVQGAHDGVDRLAAGVEPAVHQLGDRVAAAQDVLHAKADQLRGARDEWVENVRNTVRDNPLESVAAAVTMGAVIARLTRSTR